MPYGRSEPFEVILGEGIREARFGEPREVHRERFAGHKVEEDYDDDAEDYYDSTLTLVYDGSGGLEVIDISDGIGVVWQGMVLNNRPLGEVLKDLADLGFHPDEFELESLGFNSLGLSLNSPFIKDLEEDVRGVSVTRISVPPDSLR